MPGSNTGMRELCLIEGKLWSEREIGPSTPLRDLLLLNNRSFYDEDTGVVWGQRMIVGGKNMYWVFIGRPRSSMNMTYSHERRDDVIPPGLMCACLAGDGSGDDWDWE